VTHARASALRIAGAWVVVGLPLAWGLYQTVLKSLLLFTAGG
jgi:hypothetical protein